MRSVAMEILDQDLGAVGLEADAIIAIVDHTVLNDNVAAAVGVPTIRVLSGVITLAVPADADIAEDNIRRVRHKIVVLG